MDISPFGLIMGVVLLLIPIWSLRHYKTGLVKDTLIGAGRMIVQLFMIAIYLEYLFKLNNLWLNLLWVIIMIIVAVVTVLNRTKLPKRLLAMPTFIAFAVALTFIVAYFQCLIVQIANPFEARYFVPVSGMILGNMLTANVIALNSFYVGLKRERNFFLYMLGNGASLSEATRPFMRDALIKSFNPTIATMTVMGLVALPGTMTGQILGGSSPSVAIKYQIMMMISIFSSSLISVLVTLWITRGRSFTPYGMLHDDIK